MDTKKLCFDKINNMSTVLLVENWPHSRATRNEKR